MRGGTGEKAKDFKGAIKRLFKELKSFKVLITIALVLAALASILSIIAPNRLSDLTDEISEGLVVNKDNLETLTQKITTNLNEGKMEEFEIDGTKISSNDQLQFLNIMSTIGEDATAEELYAKIDEMPTSIQDVVKPFMDIEAIKKIALFLVGIYLSSALFTYI